MSDDIRAVRAIALTEAGKLIGSGNQGTATEVLNIAELFLGFLNGTAPAAAVVTKSAPAAKPVAAAKPAKKAAEPAAEIVAESEGPTNEQVSTKLGELLQANKRAEAVALLQKFGATSKSTLDAKHYAAFIEGADEILLAA